MTGNGVLTKRAFVTGATGFVIGALYGALFQLAAELPTLQKIAIATVVGVPLSLLIATAVYLFVERPFMNMRGGRRREVPAMPVSS